MSEVTVGTQVSTDVLECLKLLAISRCLMFFPNGSVICMCLLNNAFTRNHTSIITINKNCYEVFEGKYQIFAPVNDTITK